MSDLHCRAPFGVYALSLLLIPLLLYLLREPNHTGGEPLAPALDNRVLRIWPVFAVDFGVMAAFYIVPTQLPFVGIGTFSYGRIRRRLSILEVFIETRA